jgi:small subunit ribosomal protein S17
MERNRRTSLQGVVVSDKMAKTIVVEVETHKKDAKYSKRVKYSNKHYAHDEKELAHVGDTVTIMACRPLSALKRFRLVSVDKKALEDIRIAEAEIKEELEKEAAEEAKAEEAKVEEAKVEEKPAPAKKAPAKKPAAKKAPAKKPAAKKAE